MIIDSALYTSGRRVSEVTTFEAMNRASHDPNSLAWIGLAEPSNAELQEVLGSFALHETAMEDAVLAQQRAKLEENEDLITFVIRTVFYDDAKSSISTGELICFIHRDFIIIVRHGDGTPLKSVRAELELRPEFLALGPYAVLHGVLDKVIDEYTKIESELENDVVAIENLVFSEANKTYSKTIYSLKREVIEYRHAIEPLAIPLQRLVAEGRANFPESLRPYYRDISDQLAKACEHASGMDSLLTAALQADLAQMQVQQNSDVRRVSAWVALAAAPTMIAGIYGMNFDHMPELRWRYGYPLVVGSLVTFCGFLYYKFKKAGWL